MPLATPNSAETDLNKDELDEFQFSDSPILGTQAPTNFTWVRTSRLIAAVCSTSIMGAAFAVPLATMSAPPELRGVVLSMSLGTFSTVMAVTAGAALVTQRRVR